jgi:hypothetical protein
MSKLAVANVRKCLDILKKFHEAVEVDGGNEGLKKKKEMAEEALNHLENLFHPEAGEFLHESKCVDCGINVQSYTQ